MTASVEPRERVRPEPVVVKIGGSLMSGDRLAGTAATVARARRGVIVVPGGGSFADEVRRAQTRHDISDRAAHAMALLAMHQTGLLIEDLQPRFVAVETLADIRKALAANRVPVWLPTRLSVTDTEIPADWSITSDGLAARLAERLGFSNVVLVKSRRVPAGPSAAELAGEGIVDTAFVDIVARAGLEFRILGPGEERELAELVGAASPSGACASRRGTSRLDRARRFVRRAILGPAPAPRS